MFYENFVYGFIMRLSNFALRSGNKTMNNIHNFMSDESGAAAAEYALILALIAVFIIGALGALGNGISNTFNSINAKLPAS